MVSNQLKDIRKIRGMPIAELARRTQLSRVTISNIENKKVVPNLESAFLISRELEVAIDVIFFTVDVNHELHSRGE